jgi:hypothetical protein
VGASRAVALVNTQIQGIADGYALTAPASEGLGFTDIFNMNIGSDIEELMAALPNTPGVSPQRPLTISVSLVLIISPCISFLSSRRVSCSCHLYCSHRNVLHSHAYSLLALSFDELDGRCDCLCARAVPEGWVHRDHCSAFVRLLPDNSELFFAQDTWASLESMLRVYKRYNLPFSMGKGAYVECQDYCVVVVVVVVEVVVVAAVAAVAAVVVAPVVVLCLRLLHRGVSGRAVCDAMSQNGARSHRHLLIAAGLGLQRRRLLRHLQRLGGLLLR